MLKTNIESLVRMMLRAVAIHPELWVERAHAITWNGLARRLLSIAETRQEW